MSDALERMRVEFLAETEDTLVDLRQCLKSLAATRPGDALPATVLDRVFRTTHSLKGVAGMFGLDSMSTVAHAMESVLDALRQGRFPVDAAAFELLDRGHAILTRLLADADREGPDLAAAARGLLEDVTRELRTCRGPGTLGREVIASTVASLLPEEAAAVRAAAAAGRTIVVVESELPEEGFENAFRDLLLLVREWGTVHGTAAAGRDAGRGTFRARTVASGSADTFALVRSAGALGARVLFEESPPGPTDWPAAPAFPAGSTLADSVGVLPAPPAPRPGMPLLRVAAERVDRLLADLADAVHAKNRLEAAVLQALPSTELDRLRLTTVRQSLRELDRRLRTLRDGVLGVRTVNLDPLFRRLDRTFHEACRQTGKDARWVAQGGATELDKSVAEALVEPLVHLVRNAVDHGLEEPGARIAAGKSPRGTVRITAHSEGSQAVVEVEDDGGGVDFERVLAKARRLGLVGPDEQPSRSELVEVLFHPGLTAKDEPTELSGRGVGLDVVRDSLARLGGILDLDTGPHGTTFRLRIPTSLVVLTALEVEAGGNAYYLPLPNVVRALDIPPDLVRIRQGRETVTLEGEAIVTRELAARSGRDTAPRGRRSAVLLAVADRRALLWVDRLGRQREVAVRSLGMPSVPGVAGCAETADGRTVLVLDPASLVDAAPAVARVGP